MPTTHIAKLLGTSIQAVHQRMRARGVLPERIKSKSFLTHNHAKRFFDIEIPKLIIAFQIVKGGTGKTTAIHNVSCCASLYGAKILTIDLDLQGNLTEAFRINAENTPNRN